MKRSTLESGTEPAWKTSWRQVLAGCHSSLFLLDLDGTIWGDILVVLNEQFGPVDADGVKVWKRYDRAFKVDGTMTNGAHLEAEYRDLLEAKTLNELIDWLKANHLLIPGVKDFLKTLAASGVSPVAISNGSRQIAEPMLVHHGVQMPLVANSLKFADDGSFARLEFVHNEDDGVRKGDLVTAAAELGYRIIGCAGDSKGDICMAEATAKAGGLVLACGPGGLSDWCRTNEGKLVGSNDWLEFEDYGSVAHALQARIGGC